MNIGKNDALNRGLKLIKQLIGLFGCTLETHIRQRVEINEMQCRFMSSHGGTTVDIFNKSQLQKLILNSNKPFYINFVNIEKDSRYVVCLLLNKRVVGATDALHDKVCNCCSEKFFGVDVHRGSVLTPLLLIVM